MTWPQIDDFDQGTQGSELWELARAWTRASPLAPLEMAISDADRARHGRHAARAYPRKHYVLVFAVLFAELERLEQAA